MLKWWHNWKYHVVCGVSLNKICDNCSSNNSKCSPKRTHQPRIWSAGGTTNLWTMVTSAKTFYHRSEKPWFGRGIHFLESAISKSNPPPPVRLCEIWGLCSANAYYPAHEQRALNNRRYCKMLSRSQVSSEVWRTTHAAHTELSYGTVINEQCTYKFELGNQSRTDATRFRMLITTSALHLQICATQKFISLLL
jgi:hypothetical protein